MDRVYLCLAALVGWLAGWVWLGLAVFGGLGNGWVAG